MFFHTPTSQFKQLSDIDGHMWAQTRRLSVLNIRTPILCVALSLTTWHLSVTVWARKASTHRQAEGPALAEPLSLHATCVLDSMRMGKD